MKLFACPACAQVVYFENTVCERCGRALGYDPQDEAMRALEAEGDIWRPAGSHAGEEGASRYRFCANAAAGVCNWLLPADSSETYCLACRHNVTVPDNSDSEKVALWRSMEYAKHRLFYAIGRLNLPLFTREADDVGLGFEFLADQKEKSGAVMTGHDDGLVTIALAEADDAERERRRTEMGEPYRTLLGHFRHEVGHWYWDRLVRDGRPGTIERCRELFGDDTEDYGEALKRHYENGPAAGWERNHVSSYAASHAWEDFAETWAHYLHIVDTLEAGYSWGISSMPRVPEPGPLAARIDFDPYGAETPFDRIVGGWIALSGALNSFNRAMGHQDLYPFVLTPPVIEKLGFIHDLVRGRASSSPSRTQP